MKKKVLSVIFIILSILSFASCGIISSKDSSSALEKDFHKLVSETQELLDTVADSIYTNWYDSIYNDKFNSNIDLAILSAQIDNKDKIDLIKSNNESIKTLYSEIKDGKLSDEAKAVMQTYNEYYSLIIEVSGSFKTFSENKETCKKKLSTALKNLEFEF